MSVRTASSTGARSSGVTRAFRWSGTARSISNASTAVKPCAPFCTVGCVHRVAQLDELRHDPEVTLRQWFAAADQREQSRLPGPMDLMWAFVTSGRRDFFRSLALRAFRAR